MKKQNRLPLQWTSVMVFSILLTFFGLSPLFLAGDDVVNSYFRPANTFVSTTGTVIASDVNACPTPRPGRPRSYTPCNRYSIQYNYKVNGVEYASYRVNFASPEGAPAYTDAYLKKYPIGQTVTVFYDKDNPSLAVLEPDVKRGLRWTSLLMTLAGISGMIWVGWKMIRWYFFPQKIN